MLKDIVSKARKHKVGNIAICSTFSYDTRYSTIYGRKFGETFVSSISWIYNNNFETEFP